MYTYVLTCTPKPNLYFHDFKNKGLTFGQLLAYLDSHEPKAEKINQLFGLDIFWKSILIQFF